MLGFEAISSCPLGFSLQNWLSWQPQLTAQSQTKGLCRRCAWPRATGWFDDPKNGVIRLWTILLASIALREESSHQRTKLRRAEGFAA
jgi:hypothetical protein